jgi:hypothetical protein
MRCEVKIIGNFQERIPVLHKKFIMLFFIVVMVFLLPLGAESTVLHEEVQEELKLPPCLPRFSLN